MLIYSCMLQGFDHYIRVCFMDFTTIYVYVTGIWPLYSCMFQGFDHHIGNEHHIWAYIFFFIHLHDTKQSDYTALELFVFKLVSILHYVWRSVTCEYTTLCVWSVTCEYTTLYVWSVTSEYITLYVWSVTYEYIALCVKCNFWVYCIMCEV